MCMYACAFSIIWVILTQESRFSTCDVCAAIHKARKCTLDTNIKKWLQKLMEKHMQLQRFDNYALHFTRDEREKYANTGLKQRNTLRDM